MISCAAIRAIEKWKYKPKIEDGEAVVKTSLALKEPTVDIGPCFIVRLPQGNGKLLAHQLQLCQLGSLDQRAVGSFRFLPDGRGFLRQSELAELYGKP